MLKRPGRIGLRNLKALLDCPLWFLHLMGGDRAALSTTAGKVESVGPGMGFPGLVQEKDVNPASTAFTTMISQASHPPLPVHQLYECNGGADLKQILLTHTRLRAHRRTSTLNSTSTSSTKVNVNIYFTNRALVWLEQMPTPLQSLITITFFTHNSAGN